MRYGIMQHRKGYDSDEDHIARHPKTHKQLIFNYKASADFYCWELQKAHRDRIKYWVVIIDEEKELILERQDLQEIFEDDPDSSLCPDNKCWWNDIPDEEFGELTEDDLFYEDDLYNGVRLV